MRFKTTPYLSKNAVLVPLSLLEEMTINEFVKPVNLDYSVYVYFL
tara:strand:- start:37 stop:171 length:135 start_codon:yes stop_codon:yes gene_type:complete